MDKFTALIDAVSKGTPQTRRHAILSLALYTRSYTLSEKAHEQVVSVLQNVLADEHLYPLVQAECLRCLSSVCKAGKDIEQWKKCVSVCCEFAAHMDSGNRFAALESLETLYLRAGVTGDPDVYQVAVQNLRDSQEEIRIAALRVVQITSTNSDETFRHLSYAIGDMNVSVKAHAVFLLAGVRDVSPELLIKAVSKDTSQLSYSTHFAAMETDKPWRWARLQRLLELERQREEQVSTGRYANRADHLVQFTNEGDIIDALEDDNVVVRHGAIDAITELSINSPMVAPAAVDYIVDMLQDEMETARLGAAKSLFRLGPTICLEKDQLEAVLTHLNDTNADLRRLLHSVLKSIELPDADSVYVAVNGILGNVVRYPEDQESVFSCLAGIGKRNGGLLQSLVEPLLHIDHRFATREPNTGDVPYACIMVLLANGAEKYPTILSLLPPFCFGHLDALYDKVPQHLPPYRAVTMGKLGTIQLEERGDGQSVDVGNGLMTTLMSVIQCVDKNGVGLVELKKLATHLDIASFCLDMVLSQQNEKLLHEALVVYGGLSVKTRATLKTAKPETLPLLVDLIENCYVVRYRAIVIYPNDMSVILKGHTGWSVPVEVVADVKSMSDISCVVCLANGAEEKPHQAWVVEPGCWRLKFRVEIIVGEWPVPVNVPMCIGIKYADGVVAISPSVFVSIASM